MLLLKYSLSIVTFLFIFVPFSFAQATPVPTVPQAVGSAKPDPYVPCDEVRAEEFHSLRPYQASPCNPNKEDLALFCGNDLYIGQGVNIIKNFGVTNPEIIERDVNINEVYNYGGKSIKPYWTDINSVPNPCYYCDEGGICKRNPYGCQDEYECAELNCGECRDNGSTESCTFTISNSNSFVVDLQGAEFPVMGYTEPSIDNVNDTDPKVINSVNTKEETMDHATKMNEYVSWYLNGVIGRAEYPYLNPKLDCVGESTKRNGSCMETRLTNSGKRDCYGTLGIPFIAPFKQITLMADGKSACAGVDNYCCVSRIGTSLYEETPGTGNVVNYSGPIKKLLPFSIQNIERIQEVKDGYESVENNAQIRHNQVVGCDSGSILNHAPIIKVLNFLGVDFEIEGVPVKCYGNRLFNFINIGWINDKNRLTDFVDHTPPIEEDPKYLGKNFTLWLIDYKKWRGNSCLSLPVQIDVLNIDYIFYICFDNPLKPNIFGNIFSYIPFSSTEDRLGDVKIKSSYVGARSYSNNIRIIYSTLTGIQDADLFFPHMEEDVALADLLQKTFSYKEADRDDMKKSGFIPYSPYCEFKQVRSNPGDDLFAGELAADVSYSAQVKCTYFNWGGTDFADYGNLCTNMISGGKCVTQGSYCDKYYTNYDCNDGQICCSGATIDPPQHPCNPSTSINSWCVPSNWTGCAETDDIIPCPVNYKCVNDPAVCIIPNIIPPLTQSCSNEVLVGLKLETQTPLADKVWAKLVAGSSGVFRRLFPRIGESGAVKEIQDVPAGTNVVYSSSNPGSIIYAGNPSNQIGGTSAQLYFPHIGGVKEYFLTGIQTMLRPKGYGKQILSDSPESGGTPSSGDCSYSEGEISAGIDSAAGKYGIPSSMLRAMFEIEALEYIADPDTYVCERNYATAMGLTQVVDSTYRDVTCTSERYDDDTGVCGPADGKLSRCNVEDSFELAARVLLDKAGCWDRANCSQSCSFPTTAQYQYAPVCAYYGKCTPDALTMAYSYNLPSGRCNDQNYCDIVFNKMGRGDCHYKQYYCPY